MSRAVGDSVVFVEAVAKEGRNKATGASKDKYLFLTSEASNLNGILSRLNGSNRNYFASDTDLSRLADEQNGLMIRLQETLSRIVSNSAAIVLGGDSRHRGRTFTCAVCGFRSEGIRNW